jgi:hypothetical protein
MKNKAHLTPNEVEALRLLDVYTDGRFFIFSLSGSARASVRAHIMSALKGAHVPQSKAGLTALYDAFITLSGVTGTCRAAEEDNFIAWATTVLCWNCGAQKKIQSGLCGACGRFDVPQNTKDGQ